jgi:hypothetical protein
MKTNQSMWLKLKVSIFSIACLLFSTLTFAQTTNTQTVDPVYILREYMKVESGMEEDYLKTEAIWKKVHERSLKKC